MIKSMMHMMNTEKGREMKGLRDIEPLVSFFMQSIVFVAKFFRSYALFQSLCLRRGAILVRPADVQSPAISSS